MNKASKLCVLALLTACATTAWADDRNKGTNPAPAYLNETLPMEQRVEDALSRMTLDEKIAVIHAQSKFSSPGVKRLGFPDFWTDDGPHGVRPDVLWDEWEQAGQTNDSCVAFPALTCLAATWNPELARIYGINLAEEALYRGKDMLLGPGVNIFRTPLNGRNFEYMGEDPYLASRMVVPYVQGLQSMGVAACVKHFALNNNEVNRHTTNVVVSDRALYELYLPAFKAAVQEGGAWGVMGAYNLYQNQHNCHNDRLINQILKGEWQFDGVLVSDWGGTHDTDEAIRNGLDMEFGSWTNGLNSGASNAYDMYYLADAYKRLISEGKYSTRELDDKVRRVLRLFFRTTMNRQRPQGFLCSEAHYEAARQIAAEGIVLLKNDRIKQAGEKTAQPLLPLRLKAGQRILVVGENAIKPMTVGGGSSSLKVQHEVSPLDGLRSLVSTMHPGVTVDYARGYVGDTTSFYNGVQMHVDLREYRSAAELIDEAVSKARKADYVVIVGGLNKSPHQDAEEYDREQYGLPYGQDDLVEALAEVNPRIVFVNISGNPVALPWKSKVPALVQGWFIGSEAGNALADVLTGRTNPSGKLPFTWYASLDQCGAHSLNAYPGTWREGGEIIDLDYKEDIFVGYRWTDRQHLKPTFAFGHGLSYTSFSLSNPSLQEENGHYTLTLELENTGACAGSETVQLYIHDKKSTVPRPVKELKAFSKQRLQAGEKRRVTLRFERSDLAFYDESHSRWTVEPGDFEALVGTSSADIAFQLKFAVR